MKAEDIKRLCFDAAAPIGDYDGTETPESVWEGLEPRERELLIRFARACEKHGIERAKALARVHNCDSCEGGNHEPLDWSALDAEIAKENLERANPQPRIRCAGHYGEMYPRDDSCGWEGQPVELRNGCCPVCGAGHLRQRSHDDTRAQSSGDPASDERSEAYRTGLRGGASSGTTRGAGQEGAEAIAEGTQAVSPAVHPEFARGMRRAVEIAEAQRKTYPDGLRSRFVEVSELNEAVEQELG